MEQGLRAGLAPIQDSIDKTLESKFQFMIDSAVKVIRAEPCSVGGSGCPAKPDPIDHAGKGKKNDAKAPNVHKVADGVDFVEGHAVMLRRLAKTELNGESGIVVGYDGQSGRYMVKLIQRDCTLADVALKIRGCNLISADAVDEQVLTEVAECASFPSSAGQLHYVGS